ncbi:MAG: 50S ribosomal protein L3 [Candidatus Njordarchaeia archaeon]
MARRKYRAPRHGSLGYVRKRTTRIYPRVSSWPKSSETKILGFPMFKVGMLSVIETVENRGSLLYGVSRSVASTALESPPIKIIAIRLYQNTPYGLRSIGEIWANKLFDPIKEQPQPMSKTDFENQYGQDRTSLFDLLRRRVTLPNNPEEAFGESYLEKKREKVSKMIDEELIDEVRVLVSTRPDLTSIGKKIPDIVELGVGGEVKEAFEFLIEKLGSYVTVDEVFKQGEFVDIIGVTKGKGFQGVVKRFGVKILPPKTKKEKRAVGSLGPWRPGGVMWTVPRYGQLGFFKRTEYNKQIMAIVKEDYEKFNPKGGWLHYGIIRNPAVILRGSVQGPAKRMVIARKAIRPRRKAFVPKISEFYYSRELLEVKLK